MRRGFFGTTSIQFELCFDKETKIFNFSKISTDDKRFNFFRPFPGIFEASRHIHGINAAIDYAITKSIKDGSEPILIEVEIPTDKEIKQGLIGNYVEEYTLRVKKAYYIKKRKFVPRLLGKIHCEEFEI